MKALIPLPQWTMLLGFAFGAIVGSFLNVVIYRMPRGKSLSDPKHSFCPKCGHQLGVPDLFPLFSWLFSGRKCRYCGQPVSSRYFWVELFSGLLWMGIWYMYLLGPNPDVAKAIAYAFAVSALTAAFFTDIELFLIPDQLCAFLLFDGIAYNVWLYAQNSPHASTWGIPSSIAGALTGWFVLSFIAVLGRVLFRKDAMGHGDIKFARGIGAILFPALAGISFALAVVLGAVLGIVMIIVRQSTKSRASSAAPGPDEEEEYVPEPVGDLLKYCFFYMICLDVVGLFAPKLYVKWFGEDPFAAPEDLDTWQPEWTTIPFGPYLALGAILAVVFEKQLLEIVNSYMQNFGPGPAGALPAFFGTLFDSNPVYASGKFGAVSL